MVKKILLSLSALVAILIAYVTAVFIVAYFHNRNASANVLRVHVGMSRQQVDQIMGPPIRMHMTDGPGTILCYTEYPFDDYDENCGVSVTVGTEKVESVGVFR